MKILQRNNGIIVIRFDIGEEFPEALAQWCSAEGATSAAIVAGIGMLRNIQIGRYDGTEYQKTLIEESSEILSLQGNVSVREGKPFVHLHVSLAREDMSSVGGHLFSGIVSMTIELTMLQLQNDLVRVPAGGTFWKLEKAD